MGKKAGYEIDHINRDVLDNRKTNLRFVTHSQNIINAKIQSNNKSGHKGVSWAKHMNKWRAQIKDNGKTKHLGYFLNIKDAIKIRKIKEQEYYLI